MKSLKKILKLRNKWKKVNKNNHLQLNKTEKENTK